MRIDWPSPDGTIYYGWENWLADATYATPLGTFIGSDPYKVAFVASPKENRLHDITRTSSIGDDVVTMQFANDGREIETLIRTHGSGVKVEFFWFFPNVDGGTAVSWFLGYLRTPSGFGAINADYVTLTAASGQRTANMVVPNLAHPQQCPVRFGGQMTQAELDLGHPCNYDRHLSGSNGLLNAGSPFTSCPHTKEACINRWGHSLVYMGVIPVTETVPVGAGEHKTYSTTHGRYGQLQEPTSVVFGERVVTGTLLDYRREVNPSPSNRDAGTLVTLQEFSVGPVESMTEFQLMERTPQGIDYRLGTQQQTATVFSPAAPNLNRRAIANLNHNPIDPSLVQVDQMKATARVEGLNDIRVYTDQTTYTEQYTNNRAWALLATLENTWWGLRMDRSRLLVSDFIYLAGKNSTFNCQMTARSAQQQIADICESANWYLPFNYNGQMRFLPMEALDTTQADIPIFTDDPTDPARNIVWDGPTSTLRVAYQDDDVIPNRVILQFDDEDHNNITRPLVFEDWTAQQHAGDVYGDNTKRVVEKTYTAYGVTNLTEAVALGATFRDIGVRGQGGLANNLEITFVTRPSRFHEAMELHENKAIKVVSEKLDGYTDPNGDPFEFFIIKSLRRDSSGDLTVVAQAYGQAYWDGACSPSAGYVNWPTPDNNVIAGDHGADTRIRNNDGGSIIVTGDTYPDAIDPNDVIISRWQYTFTALPSSGVWNITHPSGPLGFKIFNDGTVWLYYHGGVDFGVLLPSGSIQIGSTIGIEYDRNGGSPVRRYKHNGVTIKTDTTSVLPLNEIAGEIDSALGDIIGEIYWQVYPCTPTDEQESGETGGGSVIMPTEGGELIGDPLSGASLAG